MVTPSMNAASSSDPVLARALATHSDSILVTDLDHHIIFANEAATLTTGHSAEELFGRNPRFLQGPETDPDTVVEIRESLAAGRRFEGKILNYRRDGQQFWNELTIVPLRNSEGEITHFASGQRDITVLAELEARNREMLAEITRQGDTARMLLTVSKSLSQRSTSTDVAKTIADAIPRVCGADRSAVGFWDATAGRLSIVAHSGWPADLVDQLERFTATPDAGPELATIIASGQPLLLNEEGSSWAQNILRTFGLTALTAAPISPGGEMRGLVLAHWDTTPAPLYLDPILAERLSGLAGLAAIALDNVELLSQARFNALHDPLTGLANRALFAETLTNALDGFRQSGEELAVLYCDIDRFKRTNDTLGHRVGDAVLVEVAERLRSVVRVTDLVARIGGDEFVILVPAVDNDEEGHAVAQRVRDAFIAPLTIDGQEIFAQLSVGIAFSNMASTEALPDDLANSLMSLADADMYQRKSRARGLVGLAATTDQLRLDADLRGATGRGEIHAYYQPQLDISTGAVVAVEALARWQHPTLGLLGASAFIALAEDNGLISEIGLEMLRQACAATRQWKARGYSLEIGVNVSMVQLLSPQFVDNVTAILHEYEVPPELLTLEVTETRLVPLLTEATAPLEELRNAGVRVSIDDFGTGYSSLAQLHALPVSELKVDRSFIHDGPAGETLIAAIVGLARGLGLRVVAEGAETDEHHQKVRAIGCDRIQGYTIAEPQPLEHFGNWLEARAEAPTVSPRDDRPARGR